MMTRSSPASLKVTSLGIRHAVEDFWPVHPQRFQCDPECFTNRSTYFQEVLGMRRGLGITQECNGGKIFASYG